jgi:hypothetical protein
MIESASEIVPNAVEADLLRTLLRKWPSLPLVTVDVLLSGDGSHIPCCELGSLEVAPWNEESAAAMAASAAATVRRAPTPHGPEALRNLLAGTPLDALARKFSGSCTLRMLTWLQAVRGSPLFDALRRTPCTPSDEDGGGAEVDDRGGDAAAINVRRIATGGTARGPLSREAGTVVLTRREGSKSLGLDIVGPRATHTGGYLPDTDARVGVFVADVLPDASAAAHAWIVPGLRVLRVNGSDMTRATQAECLNMLENSGNVVEVSLCVSVSVRAHLRACVLACVHAYLRA